MEPAGRSENIEIIPLTAEQEVSIGNSLTVKAFTVPHRDEYSETAGFRMLTPKKKFLFIPDIDKWSKWNKNIIEEVKMLIMHFWMLLSMIRMKWATDQFRKSHTLWLPKQKICFRKNLQQ